jgi:hypothetical protein
MIEAQLALEIGCVKLYLSIESADIESRGWAHSDWSHLHHAQVVAQILNETRAAGGFYSNLLVIRESVLVGVVASGRPRREGS